RCARAELPARIHGARAAARLQRRGARPGDRVLCTDAPRARCDGEVLAMKRRTVHLAFAISTIALAVPAAWQALRLEQAVRVNRAIAQAADPAALPGRFAEARFAHASALAAAGRYEAALAAHKAFVQDEHGG